MPKVIPDYVTKYNEAHYNYQCINFPNLIQDGFYTKPKLPNVAKANGLTQFIINYLMWSGYRATRISSAGRMLNGKFIYSTTRKGSADISSTIKGRSVMWEVKIGSDRHSEYQLAEQRREIAAGGLYYFVKNPTEFLYLLQELT